MYRSDFLKIQCFGLATWRPVALLWPSRLAYSTAFLSLIFCWVCSATVSISGTAHKTDTTGMASYVRNEPSLHLHNRTKALWESSLCSLGYCSLCCHWNINMDANLQNSLLKITLAHTGVDFVLFWFWCKKFIEYIKHHLRVGTDEELVIDANCRKN
jgi:hypothetical protein